VARVELFTKAGAKYDFIAMSQGAYGPAAREN
jgi:hypothetical protein